MLEPVSQLTQAFANSLIQISQIRERSLVLVLDTTPVKVTVCTNESTNLLL
jgi:hypothetical protein